MKYFYLIIPLVIVCYTVSFAADAYIVADEYIGRGIFRSFDDTCYVITAKHVVKYAAKGSDLYIITHNKNKIPYFIAQQYKDDIAILQLETPYPPCLRKTYWYDGNKLDLTLENFTNGEIRLIGKHGNYKKIPVVIKSVDAIDTLTIVPLYPSDKIMQGFSGSPVYIGDTPIGLLTSIKENVGVVIRQDYLQTILSTFFKTKSDGNNRDNSGQLSNQDTGFQKVSIEQKTRKELFNHSGTIAKAEVLRASFAAQGNSPLVISFVQRACAYEAVIRGIDGKKLLTKEYRYTGTLPFTPPKTGKYTIELRGIKGAGEFTVGIEEFTSDVELNNPRNVLDLNDSASGRIAAGAKGKYYFSADQNSPILITFNQRACAYEAVIRGIDGKKLLTKEYRYTGTLPFTPPKTGKYTIELRGIKGAGEFTVGIEEFTSDVELNNPRNVLDLNDSASGRIAAGAKGRYYFSADQNSPILITFNQRDCSYEAIVRGIDSKKLLTKEYRYTGTLPFTPPKTGKYTIELRGIKGAGEFMIGVAEAEN